jgi:hypothetical protein
VETGLWSGYLGTGDRKGRQQTSLTPVVTAPLLDSTGCGKSAPERQDRARNSLILKEAAWRKQRVRKTLHINGLSLRPSTILGISSVCFGTENEATP